MAQNQPFDVFWGGFLHNSIFPLELRGDRCSHGCVFCFDRLNGRKSEVSRKQPMNLLRDYMDRDTTPARLLREGYPVLCSNHTDPLSFNNTDLYLPFIAEMERLDIRYSIQSRGGVKEDELISIISQPIVWYLSIDCWDPKISRRISPGAPTPQQRIDLIYKLHEKGHRVSVGINPLNPTFLPDPVPLIDAIAKAGVKGVWVQNLHLSKRQIENMSLTERKKMGELALDQALKRDKHPEVKAHYDLVVNLCRERGLETYCNQQKDRSDYFQDYIDLYPKRYPLMQEWVNHIYDTKKSGDLIYFKEFHDFFVPKLPDWELPCRDHLNGLVHPMKQGMCRARDGGYIPRRMNYSEFLWFIWYWKETLICPANSECFGFAGKKQGRRWLRYTEGDPGIGDPILVFKPEGTNGSAFVEYAVR